MDTVGKIEMGDTSKMKNFKNEDNNPCMNLNSLKDKLGDLIDSSGGTIDAIDVFQNENMQSMEPNSEIQYNNLVNNILSQKFTHQYSNDEMNLNTSEESSADKLKNRIKELTRLNGENCK